MDHARIPTNGIDLHVARDGTAAGPLVILLHGFPEFWYGWRHQIPHLAEAGFRIWAPDQRGYNLSDKPEGVGAYTIDELTADVLGLIDAAGVEQALVVGHDWGAAVAWHLAARYPSRIRRMVIINVPHGAVMTRHIKHSPRQLLKSWYILFFQLPWLPETISRLGDWRAPAAVMRSSSRTGTFTDQDLARYREAWSQPRAFTSMIHWYRAAARKRSDRGASARIRVPTLLLWGARDQFLDRAMAQPSIELCADGQLKVFEEATHWVHHEEPRRVNHLIESFIRTGAVGRGKV